MSAREAINALQTQMETSIIGQRELIRQMIVGLLANGHLLLESLPGLAKTRAVKSMAKNLDAQMRRIQFTPDLLPSDITGTEVLHQQGGQNVFQFQPGPIFGNVILADEINRAPAKVQAALLEAMEERQITVAGTTHAMPDLFIVMATQNPIEQEGTYPLPEAQLDRFLMKVLVDYPDRDSEIGVLALVRGEEIATATGGSAEDAGARIEPERVFEARKEIHGIHVAPAIEQYIMAIVDATRHPDRYDKTLGTWIQIGASPRGGIALERTSRVNAWLEGRPHVTPDDVRAMAHGVLRHRLILTYDASAEGIHADQVIDKILELVAVPA
ncbi:AAA family ATPase [Dyella jiangningensis]|uniref:AAA family ATPase n=1 Tax=Dyella jiangningensis TaxID=1379159 RepID=A0A328P536_9GAMM|nr:MoxR family ATPase [Dyella jiangningensis]RAO75705.1 AAA family ATPase [Dyella jiangningensis]